MFTNKHTISIAAVLTAVSLLAGCGSTAAGEAAESGKLSIVCTVFSGYDWVRQILGSNADNADITYLLESGIDLHNFQPTADDIIRISDCDLFIYAGGESDKWVEDALAGAVNKDMRVINMLEAVGDNAKTEEIKEGMMPEEEEEEDEGEEEEEEYDEHVWLSVRNAKLICSDIADELRKLDPANAEAYSANLAAYLSELDKLDSDFAEMLGAVSEKTLIFGDRFPFRYFTEDYGLDYYAAFAGCSAETEASFETIVFLSQKLDELGCGTVYTIEGSDKSVAQTVINSTQAKDQTIAELDSLQSVNRAQTDAGATYISLMRENYEVLRETLSK